jgi:hypothetical protein
MLFIKSKGIWWIFAKRAILCDKDWCFERRKTEPTLLARFFLEEKKILQLFIV